MAEKVHVLPLDHHLFKPGFADGVAMPEVYEPIDVHLKKVKDMEVKDGDLFMGSFPKSGTHWMYRVLDMLQRGKAVYDERTADSTFIDVQKIELFPTLDSPRLFVSHLPYDRLPEQIKSKRTKIVHVYRDPRAVLVSFWFQMKDSMLKNGMQDFTIQQSEDMFFSEKMPFTGWFNHADQVTNYKKNNPKVPVYSLAYEDMSANPTECVKNLAKFLEVDASEQLIKDIVQLTSFSKQKETEEKDERQAALKFYRKGVVDDWKNHLTDEMKARFEQKLKERAPTCPFSAKYA